MSSANRSVWWQMLSGMRAYGIAITVLWTLAASTILVILAATVSETWQAAALGGGAFIELIAAGLTLRLLSRASLSGRLNV